MYLKSILVATIIGTTALNATTPNLNSKTHFTKELNQSELEKAKQALLAYLQAGDNSNVSALKNYMHDTYRVIYNETDKNEVKQIDKTTYLNLIEKKVFGGKPRNVEILESDQMDSTSASFKVKTSSESGSFYSYFSLIKTNGKWLVVQDLIYKKS